MTQEQEAHLEDIISAVSSRIRHKYIRGQKEHGGNLWDRPALPEFKQEVTDLNTYLLTLESQLRTLHLSITDEIQNLIDSGAAPSSTVEVLRRIQTKLASQLELF